MRTTLFAVTLTALSFLYWPASTSAQEEKVARGVLSAIGGSSVTVMVSAESMTFDADSKTRVENRGAGTKARQATADGKPGPHLSDVLTVGQAVAVTYRDAAGKRYASSIRGIPSVPNGGSVAPASEMRSTGTVKAIAGDAITIVGSSGGGGTFTQTFVVSSATKIVGKGVGTAAAAKGGKAPITDLVAAGDKVSIAYHQAGNVLQASDVRVVVKAFGSH